MAFDLDTGAKKGEYAFPPPASVCNDIAIARDGTAYATDTQNGRLFKLAKGGSTLTLYGEDRALVGVDGIRSEERRVGKECRSRGWRSEYKKQRRKRQG